MLDTPVFKRLSHNDTGAARGHQGGIVIPKEIAPFFPPLRGEATPENPTIDQRLTAEMFVDGRFVGTADTRYQHQTWGGTRSPERRLTDNLGPIRNAATAGDIALFLKDLEDVDRIQIHLLRKGTAEYARIDEATGQRSWGPLDPASPPVTVQELKTAERYVEEVAEQQPALFRAEVVTVESRTTRIARDRAFRNKIVGMYGCLCAFTRRTFQNPEGGYGLDAAHIVPVGMLGSDHPVNGVSLSKDMHWAFDKGLVGVDTERRIVVPQSVAGIAGNAFIAGLRGTLISEAANPKLRASEDAFAWHRQNVLLKS